MSVLRGKLKITGDIDRFACAPCGREHVVDRGGGIATISPVVDALKKVGVGVDKTAAELAIVRLKREIEELEAQRSSLLQLHPPPTRNIIFAVPLLVVGCLLVFVFFSVLSVSQNYGRDIAGLLFGLAFKVGGMRLLFVRRPNTKYWDGTTGVQLKSLHEQLAAKNAELKRNQDVVST